MTAWLKKNWGAGVCALVTLLSFAAVASRPVGEHFIFPTEAFRWLIAGKIPYGVVLPRCTGPFLYSPTSALFFFSWFTFPPEPFFQSLYVWLSTAFFAFGLFRFSRALATKLGFVWTRHPLRNLIWLMITSELAGSVTGVKFEISLVGGCLLAFAYWLEGRDWRAGLWLALIANFKLQALPVAMLGMAVLARGRTGVRFFTAFALGSLLFWILPLPFLGSFTHFMDVNRAWMAAIEVQVANEWMKNVYQHLYGFIERATGFSLSLVEARRLMAVVAALLGAAVFLRPLDGRDSRESVANGLLFALGLGCLYVVAFSPLSQSNAYLWYTPALLPLLYFGDRAKIPLRVQLVTLLAAYFFISLVYSDLVPRTWYRTFYDLRVKAFATTLLLAALAGMGLFTAWRSTRRAEIS